MILASAFISQLVCETERNVSGESVCDNTAVVQWINGKVMQVTQLRFHLYKAPVRKGSYSEPQP